MVTNVSEEPARPHGVTMQKTTIDIFTAVRGPHISSYFDSSSGRKQSLLITNDSATILAWSALVLCGFDSSCYCRQGGTGKERIWEWISIPRPPPGVTVRTVM